MINVAVYCLCLLKSRNNKSWTPLDIAASKGHEEVVDFLLDENVSPNPMDKNMVSFQHKLSHTTMTVYIAV